MPTSDGRDDVMAWQTQHRLDSPYPLRHNGTNVHIVERRGNEADFRSYIYVTQIVDGVSNLSTGIVTGTVRREGDDLQIAALHVVSRHDDLEAPLRDQPRTGHRGGIAMTDQVDLAKVLTPAFPPRVLDDVYTDDEYDAAARRRPAERTVAHDPRAPLPVRRRADRDDVGRRAEGPRPDARLRSRPRSSAASTARTPSASTPRSRTSSTAAASSTRSSRTGTPQYAKPTLMLFNICGPHQSGLSPHLDAVTFRGVRIENTPVWLQNIMGKSGLFTDYIVKMAQVITWWYRGEAGTFTYWPDGPLASAQDARHARSGTAASSCRTS